MGNENATSEYSDSYDIDDALMASLIDAVSAEIDDDYKHDEQRNTSYSVESIDSITELYKLQKIIGQGASGSVFRAQSKQTFKQYALKEMSRCDKLNLISFNNEMHILTQLNHPNIININNAYISNDNYYITTEYCSGGTLLNRILKMNRFSEQDCVDYIKTLLESVQYIHSKGIVHRDIKLSNIVFNHTDVAHSKLKLIDFGQSEQITNLEQIDTNIMGTLHYLPPESIRHRKKRELFAGDMWAIGVIAYGLIEGTFPYKGKDIVSMMKCIRKRPLKWNDKIPISNACKEFISALLHKDIKQRLNVTDALKHPWIINKATDDNLGDEYFEILKRLNFQNKLQRVMVDAVLHGMDDVDKQIISTLYQDVNKDDTQLINQIISGNISYKHTKDISDKTLNSMDVDKLLSEFDVELLECCTSDVDADTDDDDDLECIRVVPSSMDDIMSVKRFTKILESSPKKYDVDAIVRNVTDDGSTPITFRSIACYHHPVHSINAFAQ